MMAKKKLAIFGASIVLAVSGATVASVTTASARTGDQTVTMTCPWKPVVKWTADPLTNSKMIPIYQNFGCKLVSVVPAS